MAFAGPGTDASILKSYYKDPPIWPLDTFTNLQVG